MEMSEVRVNLYPHFCGDRERTVVGAGSLSGTVFRFESGVCGVRLQNELGHLVLLPFQGQQIWSAQFGDRELTMVSMFDQPRPTRAYLETYGGFLLHCGATAMGVPGPEDTHPLHGELPNAPYQGAYLVAGRDGKGDYVGLGGRYQHTVAFSHNYVAEPLVKLYAGSSLFDVALTVTNLKRTPMEYMYLAHINFRPVDNGRLVYSAPGTAEHVRVRRSIPSHVHPGPGYREFLEELARKPDQHHVLVPDLVFDPEVVFNIDYLADADGWAHSMQVHPDGHADYVGHRPDQVPIGVRWISRTPDQDALGIVLPATAEPEGYTAEKAKGNLRVLPAKGVFRCDFTLGTLAAEQARQMEERIQDMVSKDG